MAPQNRPLASFKVIGFDTMGTLVDERKGISTAFAPTAAHLPEPIDPVKLHSFFNTTLSSLMHSSPSPPSYRPLLAKAHSLATAHFSSGTYVPPEAESQAFADALAQWPAWPDTVAAMQALASRAALVLLSNMDTTTLSAIANEHALKAVPIAACIGCDRTGAFKPDRRVNSALLEYAEQEHGVGAEGVLLVAQGLASDHVPAVAMGVDGAWIDRYGGGEAEIEEVGTRPRWVFTSLAELVEARDGGL